MQEVKKYIKEKVHELYWGADVNCARTTLLCLSELFGIALEHQTLQAAVGLHGAGGYQAQCGLVEGGLMFIGIYCDHIGKTETEAVAACYDFAEKYEKKFGSLRCRELRPTGFSPDDSPHMCEGLTCESVEFVWEYVKELSGEPEKVV